MMFMATDAKKRFEDYIRYEANKLVNRLLVVIKSVSEHETEVNINVGNVYELKHGNSKLLIQEILDMLSNAGYEASFHPAKFWSAKKSYHIPDWYKYVHEKAGWDRWEKENKSDTFLTDYFHISWENADAVS
jgi:hypothetical protein